MPSPERRPPGKENSTVTKEKLCGEPWGVHFLPLDWCDSCIEPQVFTATSPDLCFHLYEGGINISLLLLLQVNVRATLPQHPPWLTELQSQLT